MSRDTVMITLGAAGLLAGLSTLSGRRGGSQSRALDLVRARLAKAGPSEPPKPPKPPAPRKRNPAPRVATPQPQPSASGLGGVTVTFTGFRDRDLGAAVSAAGGYPSDRFTRATGLVVAKDPTRKTGKVRQAHAKGIEVVSIPQLRRRLRGARPQRSTASPADAEEHQPAPARPRRGDPIRGGVLEAKKWAGGDPTGMWASEKYMGVRAYWNGEGLYSKNGNRFAAPAWFTDLLPAGEDLGGELYIGPGRFEDTVSVVRSGSPGAGWREIKLMVFDAPEAPGPFRARVPAVRRAVRAACASWRRSGPCPIIAVEHVQVQSRAHLDRFHGEITRRGGEGTMLRNPDSGYERFRSSNLLKRKDFTEAEGEVIGYKPGATAAVGSYRVRDLTNGAVFTVDARHGAAARGGAILPIGTVVTFKFQERTSSGKPRHPVLVTPRDYE
jgi:DNA ligase 1